MEAKRRDETGITDCGECKARTSPIERQYMGCGFEPELDRSKHRLTMWQPPASKFCQTEATICAGYTTSLPEVREVALMYRHWDTGNLAVALCGSQPNEELLSLIVMLASEINAVDVWRMTPSSEGGGAK
jgi:hypothetical protein